MKNMMKKFVALFAALAVMMSVVMPVFGNGEENVAVPCWEEWYDDDCRD